MFFPPSLIFQASKLNERLIKQQMKLSTAESCTAGLIASLVTSVPGSSACFDRGYVTYSNVSKHEMLGVPYDLLNVHGAASHEVAHDMVKGALKFSSADLAISVTGIAGPTGGTTEKPVGLVYIGYGNSKQIFVEKHNFEGNRDRIRLATVEEALACAVKFCD